MTIYASSVPPVPLPSQSIFSHVFADVGTTPDYPAFVDAVSSATLTRRTLRALALRFGHGLTHHPRLRGLQLKRGDTVCVFSPNSIEWPVVVLGSVSAGLRTTFANPAYSARELAFQFRDSRAKVIFTISSLLPVVRGALKEVGIKDGDERIVLMDGGLPDLQGKKTQSVGESLGREGKGSKEGSKELLAIEALLELGSLEQEEKFDGDQANETVFLCYSSGTTGLPKGVETTHRNLTTALTIIRPTFPPLQPGVDSMVGFLPLYHVYGAVNLLLLPLVVRVPCYLLPRFDPELFCATVERYRVTNVLVVPPVLVVLARHPVVDKYDLSSLKALISGAAPLGAGLVKQVRTRLESKPNAKGPCIIIQGYGLTETSPTTHLLPIADAERKPGSIGVLFSTLQARLVDPEYDVPGGEGEGKDVPEGARGELWIKGASVMKGYLNNPTATHNCMSPSGWFKTGDIAVRDSEGYYYIVDRKKELIKYKGFQVPPAELEALLLTHPGIADAAVIGVESVSEQTEVPRAFVVPSSPVKDEGEFERQVAKWVEGKVAKFKWLRGGVKVISVIPKSPAGKILRRELRDKPRSKL